MHRLLTGDLQVEQVEIRIVDLPMALSGTRIVQLSDFHYDGLRLSNAMLEGAIAACTHANPHLVALTGDFVTDDPQPIWALAEALRGITRQHKTVAVLGNHDYAQPTAKDTITAALTQAGVQVLWNEIAYPLGEPFPVVGMADFWSREFHPERVFGQLDPAVPRLVLSHNPDSAEILAPWRVDLQLSGHTHGGQMDLPALGNPFAAYFGTAEKLPKPIRQWMPYMRQQCYKIVRHWEWAQGLHRVGSNQLYVNRGLGTYPPGRFRCPPEVTVLTLHPA
ncbi:MAG: metallophosphoesterase [Kaiparowitsia implicata GSE-PSE-MK54-09C]|jgi:predicted MPP superfamily phosphohydrolase|nr:metallophosphoesterase [Kaiparowitsia implicata GSE-PSE-MK54-09C]